MKIKRVEPIAVSFPMKKPVFMAGVEIRQADNVLVRIEADVKLRQPCFRFQNTMNRKRIEQLIRKIDPVAGRNLIPIGTKLNPIAKLSQSFARASACVGAGVVYDIAHSRKDRRSLFA